MTNRTTFQFALANCLKVDTYKLHKIVERKWFYIMWKLASESNARKLAKTEQFSSDAAVFWKNNKLSYNFQHMHVFCRLYSLKGFFGNCIRGYWCGWINSARNDARCYICIVPECISLIGRHATEQNYGWLLGPFQSGFNYVIENDIQLIQARA